MPLLSYRFLEITVLTCPPLLAPTLAWQVFDARNMLRPLSTVMPYAPAELLAWNPLDTTSVMIGSSSGMFAFMDINNPGTAEPYQVRTLAPCSEQGRLRFNINISGTVVPESP